MRRSTSLATLVLCAGAPLSYADTGPAGFAAPAVVGSGPVATPAGSVGRGDQAALAWVTPPGPSGAVSGEVVVVRGLPRTGVWGANEVIAPGAPDVDPPLQRLHVQVAVGDLTVVAWAESRNRRHRVLAAIAPRGGRFGPPQVVAEVSSVFGATVRLAAATADRFVLVWRDRRRGRPGPGQLHYSLSARGRDFGPPHLLSDAGVSPAVVATGDGGVVAAWRARGGLRGARLAPGASRFGPPDLVSRSATVGPRLAAGRGGTVIASWISRSSHLVTRRIRPPGPVQTLARTHPQPVGRSPGAAAVAVGSDQSSIAAFVSFEARGGRAWATTLAPTGRWRALRPLGSSSPHTLGGIRAVVSTSGDGFVVWQRSVPSAGTRILEIVAARRPRGSARFTAPARLGPGVGGVDPRGIVVLTQGGGTILAAWPSPDPAGGMLVATRPDR